MRDLIKPAGFYNMKAKSIIKVAKQLVEEFGGEVPSDMDDLLSLPSVGQEDRELRPRLRLRQARHPRGHPRPQDLQQARPCRHQDPRGDRGPARRDGPQALLADAQRPLRQVRADDVQADRAEVRRMHAAGRGASTTRRPSGRSMLARVR